MELWLILEVVGMTKISKLRPLERWPAHVSKAASGLAGLGLLLLPLVMSGERPLHRHRVAPASASTQVVKESTAASLPSSTRTAAALATHDGQPARSHVPEPDREDGRQAPAPSQRTTSEAPAQTPALDLARVAGPPNSYPAPVAEPIVVIPLPLNVAAVEPQGAAPPAALRRPVATDATAPPALTTARVAPVKRRHPAPAPDTSEPPAAEAREVAASPSALPEPSASAKTAATDATRSGTKLPPHLAQPPAVADPSLPSPAAPLPPDSWSTAEIDAGRQECTALLGPLDAEVEHVAPFRAGLCGAPAPVKLQRLGGSHKVEMQPAALTNCRVVAGLADWVEETLQPAAQEAFGSPVVRIVGASSYVCRNRYNNPDQRISEHAFANAIDISAFVLADGRRIDVKSNWGPTARETSAAAKALANAAAAAKQKEGANGKGENPATTPPIATADLKPSRAALERRAAWKTDGLQKLGAPPHAAKLPLMPPEQGASQKPSSTAEARFLHKLHAGACQIFSTVLGPEANEAHRDHFHFDLKDRAKRRSLCE